VALIHTHFFSHALGMCAACEVVLPQRKAALRAAGEKYPVLWLLHGAGDDETSWIRRTCVERYAAKYGLALVMPMAQLSRYADMAYGQKFFTFIADELPGVVRDFFPLSDRREDNLIAGLSMGGAGSLRIGLSRPENYRAIGCLSAGFSNYELQNARTRDPRRERQFWLALGDGNFAELEGAALRLAEEIAQNGGPAPAIYHTCGSEDYLRNNALAARDFFRNLPGDPFHYTFEEYPGGHEWQYWDEHVRDFLKWTQLPERDGYFE